MLKMKYLIAGLGNIGAEYDNTRHNVGFDVIDLLAQEKELTFVEGGNGLTTTYKHKGRSFILLKPTTFMNLSGKAVNYWLQKEKINPENLLVILDDLNLPFGTIRLQGKGTDGGHNGLKDIDKVLGNSNYARIRIGIGNPTNKGQHVNHVLGQWSEEEKVDLPKLLKKAAIAVKSFGTIGLEMAMKEVNKSR
jgi:peptidyl-tRNA hydrolase, PTH1 family